MSQENVEVVRRAFAYVFCEGGDRAEADATFDPYVVMNPVEEAPLYGVDAIRQNFERWRDAWEELEVAVEEVIDAGDRVFLTAHHRGAFGEAGWRSIPASIRSTPCAAGRLSERMSTPRGPKLSKP